MSATVAATIAASIAATTGAIAPSEGATAQRVARASVAFGRKRGYYRILFEAGPVDAPTFAALAGVPERNARAWLDEQVDAGLLRVVRAPTGDHEELLLPGEYVPILLGDHGEPELDGARALLAGHRAELPHVLDGVRVGVYEPAAVHHSHEERAHSHEEHAEVVVELEQVRTFADVARLTRLD